MAPLWHPLGPQRPLKTPQKNPKKFSKPLKKAFSGTFVTPSDFCDSAGMADVWLGLAPSWILDWILSTFFRPIPFQFHKKNSIKLGYTSWDLRLELQLRLFNIHCTVDYPVIKLEHSSNIILCQCLILLLNKYPINLYKNDEKLNQLWKFDERGNFLSQATICKSMFM